MSLRIKIDNEEVVCDKDFTINQEMLNTPSVILNNIYPKTWEQDKDYISRFYHPNDYSKCLIEDVEEIPEEPGITLEGTDFNINLDKTKNYDYYFKGQSSGTDVITGRQEIQVAGNNLMPNNLENPTVSGLTITIGEDKSILLNGTNTVNVDLHLAENVYLPAGTYTTSIHKSGTISDSGYLVVIGMDGTEISGASLNMKNVNSKTFTLSEGKYVYFRLYASRNRTFTNFKIYPMLELGSSASEYEAYKGNTYEVNLGKNLFNINASNTAVGVDCVFSGSELSLNNTTTGSGNIYNNNTNTIKLSAGTYTFSTTTSGTFTRNGKDVAIYLRNKSNSSAIVSMFSTEQYIKNQTFTLNEDTEVYMQLYTNGSGFVFDNFVINIQLEKGIEATSYAEYFTPIELYENDKIYNEDNYWYLYINEVQTEITENNYPELLNQLNAIQFFDGVNNIAIYSSTLPMLMNIHYNYYPAYENNELLFCGIVKNSGNISLNPRQPHFQTLQVLDFKDFLSTGESLDFVIYEKTILEAIQQVISTIQDYGFVLGNVNILNQEDIIGAYSTKDKTAYDVFNYIADITQSRWTTRLIDENTVAIDFYDPTLMPQGTAIDYTQEFFCQNLIDDMTYSYGTNDYRNKQIMTSDEILANINQIQNIIANGYQTQFNTEQPIGKINSISSNGIKLTFATNQEKEMGYSADFYYTPGNNYFESDDLRSIGEILVIDYIPIVEGRQVITNAIEIDRVANSINRKGTVARYENRNDATTSTELQLIGQSYIKYKGVPEIKLKVQTRTNLWNIGDRVQFNAPIEELDTEYMVRSKNINYIKTTDTIFYTFELTSSFNSETAINYFDNQRAKAKGNINAGEYISRNVDINSVANVIFYDTNITEVQITGDNTLNSILNAPFIK